MHARGLVCGATHKMSRLLAPCHGNDKELAATTYLCARQPQSLMPQPQLRSRRWRRDCGTGM